MKYTIKDLPVDVRPRERLIKFGADALSTTELLAIILRTGMKGRTVLDLSNELLNTYKGNLKALFTADVTELVKMEGIKTAKATQIKACFELGKRLAAYTEDARPAIRKPEDVEELISEMRYLKKEYFKGLYLNAKNEVLGAETISIGGLDSNIASPREVFGAALSHSATAIVLAHNHPSGDPAPSIEDVEITEKMMDAGRLMGIQLLDHVIVGDGRFFSFKKEGLIGE